MTHTEDIGRERRADEMAELGELAKRIQAGAQDVIDTAAAGDARAMPGRAEALLDLGSRFSSAYRKWIASGGARVTGPPDRAST
jgi:hypothetical protein